MNLVWTSTLPDRPGNYLLRWVGAGGLARAVEVRPSPWDDGRLYVHLVGDAQAHSLRPGDVSNVFHSRCWWSGPLPEPTDPPVGVNK